MAKKSKASQGSGDLLEQHIEALRGAIRAFQPFLSRRKNSASLETFDEETEELLGDVFGGSSDALEAYQYAKLGETGLLPEEAQESGAHDVEPAGGEAHDHGGRELRRRQQAVPADRHAPSAAALDGGAEVAADRARIARRQRLADDAADVVLAQDRRVKPMLLAHALTPVAAGRPIEL